MALNYIWLAFFIIGFCVAVIKLLFFGQFDIFTNMMEALFDSAKSGFEISLGLTGVMTFWLGIMRVGEKVGIIRIFAKAVQPFFKTLFKDIPDGHPAYGSIAMNFSANMLGLDNAATPLGLKAMSEMQGLNRDKDTATDAQIMFLVLNTVGICLIPTSVIAIRQTMAVQQGLKNVNAADIFLPVLTTTFISFVAGMIITAVFQRRNIFKWPVILFIGIFGGGLWALSRWLEIYPPEIMAKYVGLIGALSILLIITGFMIGGLIKKINVYDIFIDGAKEGFTTSVKIIPYLVAMLAAISVFRTAGCMDAVVGAIGFLALKLGLNTDFIPALPVGLMKPLSGSGARGLMVDVMAHYGVESFPGKLAAIIQGSTETTFYVLSVYFGSVQIRNTRYALAAGLLADGVGLIAAICIGYHYFH